MARDLLRSFLLRCVFSLDPNALTLDVRREATVPPSGTSAWRAVARVLRSPVDAASCVLLPSSCAFCGSPLPLLSSAPICNSCWTEFPVQAEPVCARCGDRLRPADLTGTCRPCRLTPPPFVRAVACAPYEGRMRQAIHALKYEGLMPAANRLGRMLGEAIGQLAAETPSEMLVIPVPLHRSKFVQRGFNQARLLARHAVAVLRESHPDWRLTLASTSVVRQRATESQAGLTPRQRRQNVRGAFNVPHPTLVTGRNILLIDDILTTGATVRSVAQVLIRAGAANVWVATLARARYAFDVPVASGADSDFEKEASFNAAGPDRPARERQDQPSF